MKLARIVVLCWREREREREDVYWPGPGLLRPSALWPDIYVGLGPVHEGALGRASERARADSQDTGEYGERGGGRITRSCCTPFS